LLRIDTPPTIIDRVDERLTELEAHVAQLDLLQQLMLRLLSIMHPLSNVLTQYGASSSQEQELMQYLDELATRVHSLERTRQPTIEEFQERVAEILPALRKDIEFLRLVMDTLRVERVTYRELHDYMNAQGWPARLAPRT
jgi:DNA repair exonuclease SbcCD ATPase subunit